MFVCDYPSWLSCYVGRRKYISSLTGKMCQMGLHYVKTNFVVDTQEYFYRSSITYVADI